MITDLTEENNLAINFSVERPVPGNNTSSGQLLNLLFTPSILRFFISTYSTSSEERYLQKALRLIHHAVLFPQENEALGHHSPNITREISLCLVELYKITGYEDLITKALSMIRIPVEKSDPNCGQFIETSINRIIILLHIHSATQRKEILHDINLFILDLIRAAEFVNHKICWRPSFTALSQDKDNLVYLMRFLCIEMSSYFKNDTFLFLSNSVHLHGKKSKYPAGKIVFRKESAGAEDLISLQKDIREILLRLSTEVSSLFHNKRENLITVRIHQLLPDVKALFYTDRKYHGKLCEILFHFIKGSVYMEAGTYTDQDHLYNIASASVLRILKIKSTLNDDEKSLYHKLYWLLSIDRLILKTSASDPHAGFSFLRLRESIKQEADKDDFPGLEITVQELKKRIISNSFHRVILILNDLNPHQTNVYFNQKNNGQRNEILYFSAFVKSCIRSGKRRSDYLKSTFSIENEKRRLLNTAQHNIIAPAKQIAEYRTNEIIDSDDAVFLKQDFKVCKYLKILPFKIDPVVRVNYFTFNSASDQSDQVIISLKYNPVTGKIDELIIDRLFELILNTFKTEHNIEKAIPVIINGINQSGTDPEHIAKIILLRIKALAGLGFLTI